MDSAQHSPSATVNLTWLSLKRIETLRKLRFLDFPSWKCERAVPGGSLRRRQCRAKKAILPPALGAFDSLNGSSAVIRLLVELVRKRHVDSRKHVLTEAAILGGEKVEDGEVEDLENDAFGGEQYGEGEHLSDTLLKWVAT